MCQSFSILVELRDKYRVYLRLFATTLAGHSIEVQVMRERRQGGRHVISFPIRVRWKDENGREVIQEGLTDNVGPHGTLIYLPRLLPLVGGKVYLTVTENPDNEISVTAEVIRLERNAAHPQVALHLTENLREWKKKVWEVAGDTLKAQEPDAPDDW